VISTDVFDWWREAGSNCRPTGYEGKISSNPEQHQPINSNKTFLIPLVPLAPFGSLRPQFPDRRRTAVILTGAACQSPGRGVFHQ
jgi:hypothetical protein